MDFWSKGLGEQTIALSLTDSEPLKSEGMLYLKGRMEEPVSWEYIMSLSEDDMVDFFTLLKEPAVADHLFESPNRWRIYGEMVLGGLRLAFLVLAAGLRRLLGREAQEEKVSIQVPPVPERRRRRPGRRRLGGKVGSAPPAEPEAEAESEDPSETRSASRRG
jgi:hypothetical protein